jgi:hypothetical protein
MRVHRMPKGVGVEGLPRQRIEKVNLRDKFHILHVLDYPGDGATGGMNCGVFVVKSKNRKPPERLMVEKR